MSNPTAAVIDLGSNSIKLLVATRDAAGAIVPLHSLAEETRISAGLSGIPPRLAADGMSRGLAAVQRLLAAAARFAPHVIVLTATSAVRDAANGAEFRELIRAATGHDLRILTGAEEAALIGRGLTADPALADLRDFHVFDLGGGSLECLAFRDRRVIQAASLQLGCVRLTEKFVHDPARPFTAAERAAVTAHTHATLRAGGFAFALPTGSSAVFTGGTMTTARAILAAGPAGPFDPGSAVVPVAALRALLDRLAPLTLAQRRQIPGLPSERADVFPAALATVIAVAEAGGSAAFRHSLYNLRFGLAAEELAKLR